MSDLTISSAASLTHSTIAEGDIFPVVDISASAGSKGSKITLSELTTTVKATLLGASNIFTSTQTINVGVTTASALIIDAVTGFTGGLLDLKINGVHIAGINYTGVIGRKDHGHGLFVDAIGTVRLGQNQEPGTGPFIFTSNYWLAGPVICTAYGEASLGFSDNSATLPNAIISRRGSASLGMGLASATPAAQTFGGCQGAGTDITGGVLNIGTCGTGTGLGGVINFQSHAAGSSGSTPGTLVNVLSIISPGVVRITGIPTSSSGLSSGDIYSNSGILTIVP